MQVNNGMHDIRHVEEAEPLYRLAAAVFMQAKEDARGGPYAAEARRWLLSDGAVWLGVFAPSRYSPAVLIAEWIESQPWFHRISKIA